VLLIRLLINKNYSVNYRAIENKKIEISMINIIINTLQLAARKILIQMSLQW
jgi:hypothetical protein